ncbi:glycine cleavage system aminomethyltransferase GcvT [Comamonadaceae bacterium M7527]|nr:glycine cleavage system aminomethyltransferase GcvT [Comamonadaceae bacterium M7527]
MALSAAELLTTPLNDLHIELGARMVPFAGYSMPVQYPMGVMGEHLHTRTKAGLFDVSHMGQLLLSGPDAATALETLMPVDVVDLPVGKQRYGLLLNETGGILDDLMFVNRGDDLFVVANGACKHSDIAHINAHIGQRCTVKPLPNQALLALQGPMAIDVLKALDPSVANLVFMTGARATLGGIEVYLTRSGYTGEDGFEISLPARHATALARLILSNPCVAPIGLGARNSLRLEAGLCLYGNDITTTTTPVEANLNWAMQKVRRTGGARAGGFLGSDVVLAQLDGTSPITRKRVGLVATERVPVRDHTVLQAPNGTTIGMVTSGLLAPTVNKAIAIGYVGIEHAAIGTTVHAVVRGKLVAMTVCAMPFTPSNYFRG